MECLDGDWFNLACPEAIFQPPHPRLRFGQLGQFLHHPIVPRFDLQPHRPLLSLMPISARLKNKQYAHFVVVGIQFEKTITLFVSPLLFLFFINNESARNQRRNVFLGMAIVLTAKSFFWFLVTDQPGEFTKISPNVEKRRQQKMQNNQIWI